MTIGQPRSVVTVRPCAGVETFTLSDVYSTCIDTVIVMSIIQRFCRGRRRI